MISNCISINMTTVEALVLSDFILPYYADMLSTGGRAIRVPPQNYVFVDSLFSKVRNAIAEKTGALSLCDNEIVALSCSLVSYLLHLKDRREGLDTTLRPLGSAANAEPEARSILSGLAAVLIDAGRLDVIGPRMSGAILEALGHGAAAPDGDPS